MWAVFQAARQECGGAADAIFAPLDFGQRVPIHQALQVWHALDALDDDGTLGARLGQHQLAYGGAITTLLNAAGAQSTFARAMRILSRYWALVSSHAELICEFSGQGAKRTFGVRSVYSAGSRPLVVSLSTLKVLFDGIIEIAPRPLPLLRVTLGAPAPPAVCKKLRPYFGAPVVAGTGIDSLVFSEALATQALPEASRQRRPFDRQRTEALLPPDDTPHFHAEVIKEMQLFLPHAPTLTEVADAMALSSRTLQRRLREQGLTFRGLLLMARVDLARGFLHVGGSVAEVAFLLGYRDATAFSRMYKKEVGHPPEQDLLRR